MAGVCMERVARVLTQSRWGTKRDREREIEGE